MDQAPYAMSEVDFKAGRLRTGGERFGAEDVALYWPAIMRTVVND